MSVLLHSAISQPPTESDTYTVRIDESLSLLVFSSLTPLFFYLHLLFLSFIFTHHTSQLTLLIVMGYFSFNSVALLLSFMQLTVIFIYVFPE